MDYIKQQKIKIPDRAYYPILNSVANNRKFSQSDFKRTVFIGVLHFLPNLIVFLNAYEKLGLKPKNAWLLYKDYDYKHKKGVIELLSNAGYHVSPLKNIDSTIKQAISHASLHQFRILIVEDGANIINRFHSRFSDKLTLVAGSVEQTTKGMRVIEALESNQLKTTVMDVARSTIKSVYEPVHVARSVITNIENLLSERSLSGKTILVIGFGRIGEKICYIAKNAGMIVSTFDKDKRKLARALIEGYYTCMSLHEALKNAWLVIGATGSTSLDANSISALEHGTYLASASSGEIEFDLDALDKYSVNIDRDEYLTTYTLYPNERKIQLLANGKPINFHNYSAVSDEIIDIVLSAMFISSYELIKSKSYPVGIISVNDLVERYKIEELFFDFYQPK